MSQRPRTAAHTTAQHALADEQRNTTAQHSDSGSSSSSSTRQERHSTTADQASRGVSRQTCCLRLRRATCPKRARKQQNRQPVACTRSAGKADAKNSERHVQPSMCVGGPGSGSSYRTCVCMEFWPWVANEDYIRYAPAPMPMLASWRLACDHCEKVLLSAPRCGFCQVKNRPQTTNEYARGIWNGSLLFNWWWWWWSEFKSTTRLSAYRLAPFLPDFVLHEEVFRARASP